jgi:hypothetical protein
VIERLSSAAVLFHVANEGRRGRYEAAQQRLQGLTPGVPDYVGAVNGQMMALELKAPGGMVSPVQREMHQRTRDAGVIVGIAYDLNEALRFLEVNGVITGHTLMKGGLTPPEKPLSAAAYHDNRRKAARERVLGAPGYGRSAPRIPGLSLEDMLAPASWAPPQVAVSSSAA